MAQVDYDNIKQVVFDYCVKPSYKTIAENLTLNDISVKEFKEVSKNWTATVAVNGISGVLFKLVYNEKDNSIDISTYSRLSYRKVYL